MVDCPEAVWNRETLYRCNSFEWFVGYSDTDWTEAGSSGEIGKGLEKLENVMA